MRYKYGTTHYNRLLGTQYSIDNGVLYKWYRCTGRWARPHIFTLEEVINHPAIHKVKQ